MKLSEWARKQNVSYRTAWRWFHEGRLPVRAEQVGEGKTILVFEDESGPAYDESVVIYCRVSGHDRKDDLGRQTERLKSFASAKGWPVKQVVEEIGSGLNGKRTKLLKLLSSPEVGRIIVENPDRLARFGFEFIEAAMMSQGRSIIVADETEETADIWADFIDVVTSMCERIYGKRGARDRARKVLDTLKSEDKETK
ncbi:MAG: IS607 family transposase [Actinobacteria bacterium]|nr:IS607 family transposase [Actinomycetota bacterium]MCG2817676.1 IS607 family transposase [Actinomycetes bacterium]MBU4219311.1 IS607 family transposase [Actinomycetota bacterium]MBU4359595.1 IS607 family transposase [Actinomycetota bacterium]MBU4392158.1 IS607 family transposase [Actinomycetota bacterium]